MIIATALNFTRATMQDIFDFVVLALIQQGRPSTQGNGSCLYRSGPIDRCAAGHLISDSEYADGFRPEEQDTFGYGVRNVLERTTVTAVIENGHSPALSEWVKQATGIHTGAYAHGKPQIDEYIVRLEFLRELQAAHDKPVTVGDGGGEHGVSDAEWLAGFRRNARAVAATYNLDPFMVGYRSGV